jgi:ABC-type polysaccharide/polyol phosphate transport system ATPase subunit
MNPAIQLSQVCKSFILPHERRDTLKENVIHFLRKRTYEDFSALKDVSLNIQKGDFIGIVGKNGSGKSTLLKIIAGIYKPNSGDVQVTGTIAPFLELGVGFQPELTARENITINATLLGMDRKQIKAKFKEIVEFAEIENFLDLKIKNFSSGMRARLAFAIAKEADADIYLCDEVLAVGDESFQKKCLEVFKDWRKKGKTIILVSHNSDQIKEFCTKAALLENGKIIMEDEPEKVVEKYHQREEIA